MTDILQIERRGEVDWLTLNRPDRLNAINQPRPCSTSSNPAAATPRRG